MELLGIDHIVIAVPDPDAAAADLEAAIGIRATGGGRHESGGTWNRLAFLGSAYLELIGVWDARLAAAHPIGRVALAALEAGRPGLVACALATDSVARDVARLRAAGSAISDPIAGSRRRADGSVVAWRCAFPPELGPDRPPFLIEHDMAGPEWDDAARADRARFVHPFGGRARLVGLELPVADPSATAAAYRSAVGVAFAAAPDDEPGAREARVGEHAIRLVPPGGHPRGAQVGILGSAGARATAELWGIRFARL